MSEEQVMDDYTQYLLRIGYYYTKDIEKSKDLVQDVFITFYYANYTEQGNVKAYLARLMTNRCKDYLKSWSYRKLVLRQTFMQEPVVHEKDSLIQQEEQAVLDEAILGLKLKLREVIVYYYLEQLTTREIAGILPTWEDTLSWSFEEQLSFPPFDSRSLGETLKLYEALSTGTFAETSENEGYISFMYEGMDHFFQLFRNEEGICQVAFMPMQ